MFLFFWESIIEFCINREEKLLLYLHVMVTKQYGTLTLILIGTVGTYTYPGTYLPWLYG